jgi:hypothetical protein
MIGISSLLSRGSKESILLNLINLEPDPASRLVISGVCLFDCMRYTQKARRIQGVIAESNNSYAPRGMMRSSNGMVDVKTDMSRDEEGFLFHLFTYTVLSSPTGREQY